MALSEMYKMLEQSVTNIVKATGRQPPSFSLGAKDAHNTTGGKPRITWMPVGGPIKAMKTRATDEEFNPRHLWCRAFTSAAFIWSTDIDDANDLMNHVVSALDALYHGGYRLTAEKWDVTGDRDAGNTIVLQFEVELAFLDQRIPVAQVTSVTAQGEVSDA